MNDLINISVGDAAMTALLGYAVVFIGIIMLMILVLFVGDLMFKSAKRKAAKAPAAAPATPAAPAAAPAPAAPPPSPSCTHRFSRISSIAVSFCRLSGVSFWFSCRLSGVSVCILSAFPCIFSPLFQLYLLRVSVLQ